MEGAGHILDALNALGWASSGGMGLSPLSAVEIATFCDRALVELGPIDFRDVVLCSRVFVDAYALFDGVAVPAPWEPELTPAQRAEAEAAFERQMDRWLGGE